MLTTFFDNVVWDGYNSNDFTSTNTSNAAFALGPGPVDFAATLIARAQSDPNVAVTNNISETGSPYDCSGRFVYLAGELFTTTPSVAAGSPVTLTSVLQPAIFAAADPTGSISILEASPDVATASMSGRVTRLTVPSVGAGAHAYTARYSGDVNYAPFDYGGVAVNGDSSGGGDFTIIHAATRQLDPRSSHVWRE